MSNHPLRPLRHRAVRRIWAAGVFSDIGTWIQLVIVGSLVARETGSALKTGLIAMATMMPPGLCAPVGGLLADRYDRRRVFIAGLVSQGVVTGILALAIAKGLRDPLLLSAIILVSSSVGSLANPAYSAMLPDLVPPDELMAMVALGIYSWNSGRIVGPLLATVVGAAVGPAWTVAFNAITFVLMGLAVSTIRQSFMPPAAGEVAGIRTRMVAGWRALHATPGCQAGGAMSLMLNVCVAAFMGLIPIYARSVFHGGTGLSGTFSSVQGVGAIAGSIATTVLAARLGRSRLLTMIVPLLFVSFVVYALAPVTAVALLAVAGLGCGSSALFVASMAVAQRDAPDAERGRVLSLIQSATGGGYGIGILWIGALGDLIGLRSAFLCGAASLVVFSAVLVRLMPDWRAVLDGTAAVRSRLVQVEDTNPSPAVP